MPRLKKRLKQISANIRLRITQLRIELKWAQDKKKLPLSTDHKCCYKSLHQHYHSKLGCFPDLITPHSFNDKVQWLKLFDQDALIIKCTDKLTVRNYVDAKLRAGHLPKIYQSGKTFEDLDISALPQSFVIKTNHDSGSVILVRNKGHFDFHIAKTKIERSLLRLYGVTKGEWAYKHIIPRVFAEEYIGSPNIITPPPDYKFHCVNGRVQWLQYIYNRNIKTSETIVDPAGKTMAIHLDTAMRHSIEFKKPSVWQELIHIAETLSKPFKYVRVDLYLENGTIYVGELTFHPLSGCYRSNGQATLGNLMDLDKTTVKKPFRRSVTQSNTLQI